MKILLQTGQRHRIAVFLVHDMRQQLRRAEAVRNHGCRHFCCSDMAFLDIRQVSVTGFLHAAGGTLHHFGDMTAQEKTCRHIDQLVTDLLFPDDNHF